MVQTMDKSEFRRWFANSDSRKDQFSWEGLGALFDYIEDYEDSTGEQIEFDPIALCVEYTEYENLEELRGQYGDIESMEDLQDHTSVIEIPGTDRFIIADY